MKLKPDLSGVSETMLWTLHNRASEAKKKQGLIYDPEAARIYDALDYDFERSFGRAEGSHAVRAAEIDRHLRQWLEHHPYGWVVSLGEGLETQFSRVDNGRLNWLTVDLPAAIQLRDKLLPTHPRCHRFIGNALDRHWMDLVPTDVGGENLCIIAQGLFMYLREAEIRQLMMDIATRFPGCMLIFDTVPRWVSRITLREGGLKRTPYYTIPQMHWGIDVNEVGPTLRDWGVSEESETKSYRLPYGMPRLMTLFFGLVPRLQPQVPAITWAILRPAVKASRSNA